MSAPLEATCARTDAVLALYLDGDIGTDGAGPLRAEDSGFDFVCPDTLASHMAQCETCAAALRRARRLDALLAEGTGRAAATFDDSEEAITRLFAAVTARAAAVTACPTAAEQDFDDGTGSGREHHPARRRAPKALLPAATLLGVATLLVAGWSLLTSGEAMPRPRADTRQVAQQAQPTAAAPTPVRTVAIPTEPIEPTAENTHAEPIALADDVVQRAPKRANRKSRLEPAAPDALTRFADRQRPTSERLAAVEALLAVDHGHTQSLRLAALTERLAATADAELLTAALRTAGNSPHFLGHLRRALRRQEASRRPAPQLSAGHRQELDDTAALVVASRIGTAELDTAVRRVVRRRTDLAPIVAAAVRQPSGRPDPAAFLLAVWNDLAVRHPIDDADMARQLFADQDAPVFAEVDDILAASGSAPQRVRCLLALGCSSDPQSVTTLLSWAASGCRRETYAAAWALAQLPHGWLDSCATRARTDRSAFVLRAALARARLPAAAAWTEPLGLSASEQATMLHAPLGRFPQVAEWFRDGPDLPLALARSAAGED